MNKNIHQHYLKLNKEVFNWKSKEGELSNTLIFCLLNFKKSEE